MHSVPSRGLCVVNYYENSTTFTTLLMSNVQPLEINCIHVIIIIHKLNSIHIENVQWNHKHFAKQYFDKLKYYKNPTNVYGTYLIAILLTFDYNDIKNCSISPGN